MKYGREVGPIAAVKYEAWAVQRPYIANTLEVEYESLAAHPLWIAKEDRRDFGPKQTARRLL